MNIARRHNVTGYVRNLSDGRVELVMEGPPQEIDEIVSQALTRKEKGIDAPAIWMQLRLGNLAAAERARAAGLIVIVDKCVKMEHGRYRGGLHFAGMNTEIISARKRRR